MSEAPRDRTGRRRSPVTLPGYHKGRTPRNKGLSLPAEPLTQQEVASIMRRIAPDTTPGKRLRAMMELMYRAEVKIGTLANLSYRHYDDCTGTLTIPGV